MEGRTYSSSSTVWCWISWYDYRTSEIGNFDCQAVLVPQQVIWTYVLMYNAVAMEKGKAIGDLCGHVTYVVLRGWAVGKRHEYVVE